MKKKNITATLLSKRGAKPKTSIDRLRPKVWYWEVRSRGWEDADLDVEFVPDKEGRKHEKDTRIKAFEDIRLNGTSPSDGSHHARPYDLVRKVDSHPDFTGTAKVFYSPFWKLLDDPPGSADKATQQAEECLQVLGLKRLYGREAIYWLAQNESVRPIENDFESFTKIMLDVTQSNLHEVTSDLPLDLDLIALLGALYIEATLTFHALDAVAIGDIFYEAIAEYCARDWIREVGDELEEVARHRILFGERDYVPSQRDLSIDVFQQALFMASGVIVNTKSPKYKEKLTRMQKEMNRKGER